MACVLWFSVHSWSHSPRGMLRRVRPHRPPLAHSKPADRTAASASAIPAGEGLDTASPEAFGNLVDFARLQMGSPSAEICDACNTINIGSARHCKCCARKLPAFYAAVDRPKESRASVLLWQSLGLSERASVMDFAAFSVVINVLIVITASIPIR